MLGCRERDPCSRHALFGDFNHGDRLDMLAIQKTLGSDHFAWDDFRTRHAAGLHQYGISVCLLRHAAGEHYWNLVAFADLQQLVNDRRDFGEILFLALVFGERGFNDLLSGELCMGCCLFIIGRCAPVDALLPAGRRVI